MSGNGHRIPAKKEARREKGEFSQSREIRRAKGVLFSIGLYNNMRGRVLINFVDKKLAAVTRCQS